VRVLTSGVTQGSVLGHLIFLLYAADLDGLASAAGLSSHFYADDSQLYTTGTSVVATQLQQRMESGVEVLADWLRSNRLLLNPDKTDFLWCATRRRCGQLSKDSLNICGTSVRPSTAVRDLGVLFEADMSMTRHVSLMVGRCFRQLRLIKSCVRALPFEAAKTAVVSFVVSQVDRCNSLLAGAPKYLHDRLQSVLNAAARLVCYRRKYDHVTPLLRDVLHWLPVPYRIEYKLSLLVYRSLHGSSPDYLRSYCVQTASSNAGLALRSNVKGDLHVYMYVRRTKTRFGERAFSTAGPSCWNSLPPTIRSADSVESFKSRLNSYLFSKAYL
jgi:hypothetical protein